MKQELDETGTIAVDDDAPNYFKAPTNDAIRYLLCLIFFIVFR